MPIPDDFADRAAALRPFYFMVVVWGKRYRDLLLDYCIGSLLSPNNIPALLNQGNKFLIATTEADWDYLQDKPLFRELRRYCEIVFLPIPPCPPHVNPVMHMGMGHKLATQRAFEDRAYGAILTPDMMHSDGTVAAMQRRAVEGYQVMLTAALRFGEEPLFEHLKQLNVVGDEPAGGQRTQPVIASGRQLAQAGLRSFHSETLTYEWDQPYFARVPSAVWWRVPGEDGIVVHSLSWAPLLVDYGAIQRHDDTTMDEWTIDGDYIHKNFGLNGKVYVVQDSDEVMQISWAPLADRPHSLEPRHELCGLFGVWNKGVLFHKALADPMFDPLKCELLPTPVYWHGGDIREEHWGPVQKRAHYVLTTYGGQLDRRTRSVMQLPERLLRYSFENYKALKMAALLAGIRRTLTKSNIASRSWVDIGIATKLPAYNTAANEARERCENSAQADEVYAYIVSRMAEIDRGWGVEYEAALKIHGKTAKLFTLAATCAYVWLRIQHQLMRFKRLASF